MSEKESEFKRFPRRQREDTSALTRGLASTTGEEDATPPRQKQQQQQLIFFFSFRPRRRLFGETEMGLHSANHWQSRDARRRGERALLLESGGKHRKAQLYHTNSCGLARGCPVRARRHSCDRSSCTSRFVLRRWCLVGALCTHTNLFVLSLLRMYSSVENSILILCKLVIAWFTFYT
jgi:hypothetical protein